MPFYSRPPLPFTLDHLLKTLSLTLFSPSFMLATSLGLSLLTDPKLNESRPRWLRTRVDLGEEGRKWLGWGRLWAMGLMGVDVLNGVGRCWNNKRWPFALTGRFQWNEQIVIITGGASGVGKLLAETVLDKGATVVILDIASPEASFSESDGVFAYICDVSDYQAVRATARRLLKEVGRPTVLVNNAGVVAGKLLLDLEERDITRTFGVNTLSHYWTIKAFLPSMLLAGRGHIITVSSVLGLVGSAQMTDYCASKAALIAMHDSLRFELTNRYKSPNIRTSLILPGHIQTPLFDRINFPQSTFFRLVAPSLKPMAVVDGIVDAIEARENRVVRLPAYTHSARILNLGAGLVPGWARDFLQWMSQADYTMVDYGRQEDDGSSAGSESEIDK